LLGKKLTAWASVLQRVVDVLNYDKITYRNSKAVYSAYYSDEHLNTVVLPSHSSFFKYQIGDTVQANVSVAERKKISFKYSLHGGKLNRLDINSLKEMVSPTDISVKIPIVFTFSLVTFSIFLLNYSVYIPENLIPELVFVKTISENIYFYVGKLSSTTYVITSRRLITTKKDVIVPFYTCTQIGSNAEVSKKYLFCYFWGFLYNANI